MKLKKMEISDRVVQRLTEYLSILKEVRKYEDGINSIELSKIMDTTSAQVRKDLSTFGEFGVRGKGYDIDKLIEECKKWTQPTINHGDILKSCPFNIKAEQVISQ